MQNAWRTMSRPVRVRQVVSRTSVPGRYRRPAGTITPLGANRKAPAARSRMAANTLGLSGRGRHIHSTRPLGAMRALTSQSDRKAYSAMGGKALAMWPIEGAGAPAGPAGLPPLTAGSTAFPRSSMRAFLATFLVRLQRVHAPLPNPLPFGEREWIICPAHGAWTPRAF